MKQILILVTLLMLNGCVLINKLQEGPNNLPSGINNLQFMDTDSFEQKLLDSMSVDTKEIEVDITGNISINEIPQRLGKWLSVVEKNGGTLNMEPNTRSIGLILSFLPTVYHFLKEELTDRSVSNYNAIVFRDLGTGYIDKIVFTHKN